MNYLLKISRPDCEADFVAFQTRLDKRLQAAGLDFCPQLIENKSGEAYGVWDLDGSPRMVRFFLFSLAVLFPIQSLKVDLQVGKQYTKRRATCFVYMHVNKKA